VDHRARRLRGGDRSGLGATTATVAAPVKIVSGIPQVNHGKL